MAIPMLRHALLNSFVPKFWFMMPWQMCESVGFAVAVTMAPTEAQKLWFGLGVLVVCTIPTLVSQQYNDNLEQNTDRIARVCTIINVTIGAITEQLLGYSRNQLRDESSSLNLAHNRISSFRDILNLARLGSLKSLSFSDPHFGDNPLCSLCNYQTYCLFHLQQLKVLDANVIAEDARQLAAFMAHSSAAELRRWSFGRRLKDGNAHGTEGAHTARSNAELVRRFNAGELDGLIATPVGESALDVYNARFRYAIVVDAHSGHVPRLLVCVCTLLPIRGGARDDARLGAHPKQRLGARVH